MHQTRIIHRLFIFLTALGLFLSGCGAKAPVRLGFTAELSGKQSEPSVNLRNGVQLAIEEINEAGGIDGRMIELVVEDDLGTPEGAKAAQNKLIDSGVAAVVGHFTSNQTVAGHEVTEARRMVLVSATASTSLLSGKKDLFFRTVASTEALGAGFARYLREQRQIARISIIYDKDNDTYSTPMVQAFAGEYGRSGGIIDTRVDFSGNQSPNFAPLVNQLQQSGSEAVLIIASPPNTGLIAQAINLAGWKPALFAASWAQGDALIQNGGQTVEGMEFIIAFDVNDPEAAMQAFKAAYQKRFSRQPIFTAMEGYETMYMLAEALKVTGGEAKGLPEALLGLKNFRGLIGPVSMDEYGDVVRPLYIQRVKDGEFETIKKLPPLP